MQVYTLFLKIYLTANSLSISIIRLIVVVIARNAQFTKTKIVNQVRNIIAKTPTISLTISNSTAAIILNESSNFKVANLITKNNLCFTIKTLGLQK